MEKSNLFWNEAAKYGALIGITMSASKVLENSMIIYGGLDYTLFILLEWLLMAALYCAILYKATQKRAAIAAPERGYSYFQGVNYMMLISAFAAVIVSCVYYVYINSFVGYHNYMIALSDVLQSAASLQPIDAATAQTIDMLIEQMHSQPQASIFSLLFSTIVQYAFAGVVVGMLLSGFISRRPQMSDNEQ